MTCSLPFIRGLDRGLFEDLADKYLMRHQALFSLSSVRGRLRVAGRRLRGLFDEGGEPHRPPLGPVAEKHPDDPLRPVTASFAACAAGWSGQRTAGPGTPESAWGIGLPRIPPGLPAAPRVS